MLRFRQLTVSLVIVLASSLSAIAMVKGDCVNCHTMHNSQDGTSVDGRSDAGFGSTDSLENLLNNDCIGCHSSTGSQTIVTLGETRIPIVYNLAVPTAPLAAGNFYWVETSGDEYGHNVRTVDSILNRAPGIGRCGSGGNGGLGGCHASLASIAVPQSSAPIIGNGCIGCHDPAHHANDETALLSGGSKYVGATGGGYRFINQAAFKFVSVGGHRPAAMVGIEDPDWEQQPDLEIHNEYQDSAGVSGEHGMSEFCTGCHGGYHALDGNAVGDMSSPWLRHPAGIVLPADGEYAGYTEYDPQVPIARANVAALAGMTGPSSTVTPGVDKVMCLSCHRAHGSPYPDMLRWNYTDMRANSVGDAAGTGCFKCHTLKDGV